MAGRPYYRRGAGDAGESAFSSKAARPLGWHRERFLQQRGLGPLLHGISTRRHTYPKRTPPAAKPLGDVVGEVVSGPDALRIAGQALAIRLHLEGKCRNSRSQNRSRHEPG